MFATSFNRLPSVVKGAHQQRDFAKALFKLNDTSVQTMKVAGSSSVFPTRNFMNRDHKTDHSMVSLLQQVAELNIKKKERRMGMMLNAQASMNLPIDLQTRAEIEAMEKLENSHIKIMGENQLFVLQPNPRPVIMEPY